MKFTQFIKSDHFGCFFFNFLMGIACVIHIEIAVRFDFPYKGGYYSDYVLGSLHTLITLSIMWNLIHFIRLVIKNAPQNTEDN
jgi:hypothetical protein